MHEAIIFLEQVEKPLTKEELDDVEIYINDFLEQPAYTRAGIEYIGSEYSSFDANKLASIYNGNVLELVEEDKNNNFFHVFRIKQDAVKYVSEVKIKKLNDLMAEINSSNFRFHYDRFASIIIPKLDTYIVENEILYPLDEWLLAEAEEGAMYQIVQILDASL